MSVISLNFFTVLVDGKEYKLVSDRWGKKATAKRFDIPLEIIIKRGAAAGLPEVTEEILQKAGPR